MKLLFNVITCQALASQLQPCICRVSAAAFCFLVVVFTLEAFILDCYRELLLREQIPAVVAVLDIIGYCKGRDEVSVKFGIIPVMFRVKRIESHIEAAKTV